MEKSSLILIALTVIAAFGVFNYGPEKQTQPAEELYQFKIEFDNFKFQFNKKYQVEEEAFRFKIFKDNLNKIRKHNADSTQSYEMGVNQFTDMTQDEFTQQILVNNMMNLENIEAKRESIEVEAPTEVDWRSKGVMTPVKNQGSCGSCWSFSATGVAESWALFSGKSWDLSEQQLVDCSASYGNHGCNGGWPSSALKYVKDHGLTTEQSYPYVAKTNACVKNGGEFHIANVLTVAGCTGLSNGISARPLSITVDATNWSNYKSGVFNNCAASINHAVLLVGTDAAGVWKVKNSWGTSWGESGYIRLAAGNTCGVCAYGGVYVA